MPVDTTNTKAPPALQNSSAHKKADVPVAKALLAAAVFVVAAVLASSAGLFSQDADDPSPVAMQWPGPLGLCLNPAQGSVCFDQPNDDGVMHLVASGLKPESIVTIESSAGNVNLTVDGNGFLEADIGGELVKRDFTTTGTWGNDEPLFMEVLIS